MDEVQSLIVAAVRDGKTITEAAREAGRPIGTVRRWLTEGRTKPDGSYGAFARSVDACRLAVPEAMTGDRFAEIEAVGEHVGEGDAAASALLGLARALARKIDWCETTPTGAAAMALANLSKQYREVLAEVAPPSSGDVEWVTNLMSGTHEYHFEEALERIAKGEMTAEEARSDAAATLARVAEWREHEFAGPGVFAAPGTFENLDRS